MSQKSSLSALLRTLMLDLDPEQLHALTVEVRAVLVPLTEELGIELRLQCLVSTADKACIISASESCGVLSEATLLDEPTAHERLACLLGRVIDICAQLGVQAIYYSFDASEDVGVLLQ